MVAALSATFTTASAKDKKECSKAKTECCKVDKKNKKCKKDKTSCCEAPVSLLSKSDSLSYAAGHDIHHRSDRLRWQAVRCRLYLYGCFRSRSARGHQAF